MPLEARYRRRAPGHADVKDYTDDQEKALFGTQILRFLKEAVAKLGVRLEASTMILIGLSDAMNDQFLYDEVLRRT